MDQNLLLTLAKKYFIFDAGLSTVDLTRAIQQAEGEDACFASGKRNCEQQACRWRDSCLPTAERADDV